MIMKLYLLHQTHTDIGYTDRQEKIVKFHVDYLKQAIIISEKIANGSKPEWEGFVWNNETFWILDEFLKHTDSEWENRLLAAVKRNHIQITGNYINLTDLVDYQVLKKYLNKAKQYGIDKGIKINSAISMDINGWGFGYSQALYDAGIRRFYTCVHNHHGFVPFFKKHNLFYWETPSKDKLLVWNGDVYNQGNTSRLVPNVVDVEVNGLYETKAIIDDARLTYAKKWIDDYCASLRKEGYSYDFFPMFAKGILVDNAPPNGHIMEAIKRFNELFGNEIEIEMIGINDFFDKVEAMNLEIPMYTGDWNDWWSDGYMSSPKAVQLYREAQRNYHKIISLRDQGFQFDESKLDELEYNLIVFSEHTWGYFTSVSEPWNKMTVKLDSRNEMFAFIANKLADELIDDYTKANGEMMKHVGRPMRYKIENPFDYPKTDLVKMYINWWEGFQIESGYEVYNIKTGEVIPHQETRVDNKARREVRCYVKLGPFENVTLGIRGKKEYVRKMPLDPLAVRDQRVDFVSPYVDHTVFATEFHIESPFVKISWKKDKGITEFIDKLTNCSLVIPTAVHAPLTPVYNVSKVEYKYKFDPSEMVSVRTSYGRNRNLISSEEYAGRLINAKILANGPLFARVQLKYELEGTLYSVVEITVYKDKPQVDFSYIFGKHTVWEPESIYLSLPFTMAKTEELWLDKSGAIIRPRIDQLPGTMSSFYTMQSGYALVSKKGSIIISTPDAPLLKLGSLEPSLFSEESLKLLPNADIQYSWLMNNYWETNFATSLGGFYRFDYSMELSKEIVNHTDALHKAKSLSQTFLISQVGYE